MTASSHIKPLHSTVNRSQTIVHKIALISTYLFVFTIPAENIILISGIGTISRLVGGISLGLWVALVAVQRLQVKHFRTAALGFILMFMLYGLISTLWAVYPELSLVRTVTNLQLLAFIFLLRQFVVNENIYRSTLIAYCIGAIVTSASVFQSYYENFDRLAPYIRLTAQNFNPNEAGINIVISILLVGHLIQTQKSVLWRVVGSIIIGIQTIAVLLTASRGAAIGMMIVYLSFGRYVFQANMALRIFSVALSLTFIQVLSVVIPSTSWERLSELQSLSQSDPGLRLSIWEAGFRMWLDYPVFGVGVDSFRFKLNEYTGLQFVAHNTFLSVLAEQGIIGFLLFVLILVDVVISLRYVPTQERWFFLSVLLVWGVLAFSGTSEYKKITWFAIGLPMVRVAMVQDPNRTN